MLRRLVAAGVEWMAAVLLLMLLPLMTRSGSQQRLVLVPAHGSASLALGSSTLPRGMRLQ